MDGWIKHFADNTVEYGWDHLVHAKQASWTKGRHELMIGVSLNFLGVNIKLHGSKGEYHQFDTYETSLSSQTTKIVERTIQKKLTQFDQFMRKHNNTIELATFPAFQEGWRKIPDGVTTLTITINNKKEWSWRLS